MKNRSRWIQVGLFVAGIFILQGAVINLAAFAEEREPVIYLSFDQNTNDSGPFQLKGEVHGDEVKIKPGKVGNALFVGGTKDWLDFPLDKRIVLENGFTGEVWFRRDDWTNPYKGGSGFQTLFSITTSVSLSMTAPGCPLHEPWMLVASVDEYRKDVQEAEYARAYSPSVVIQPNKWVHAAMVYTKSTSTLTLYLNGKVTDTAHGVPVPSLNVRNLRLGTWFEDNQAFRGSFDEFKCYDYPRSAQEILSAARIGEKP